MKTFAEAYASMTYQEKLAAAERLGVTLSTISRWASTDPQKKRTPDLAMAYRIEAVVGISLYSWVQPTPEELRPILEMETPGSG